MYYCLQTINVMIMIAFRNVSAELHIDVLMLRFRFFYVYNMQGDDRFHSQSSHGTRKAVLYMMGT